VWKIASDATYLTGVRFDIDENRVQAGGSCYFVVPLCIPALAVCAALIVVKGLVDVRLRGNAPNDGEGGNMEHSGCGAQQTKDGVRLRGVWDSRGHCNGDSKMAIHV
jgi:hypothetical protein